MVFTLKGQFTPSESGNESEKDQRTSDKEQRKIFAFDFVRTMCERVLMFAVSRTGWQRSKKIADITL